VRIHEEEFFLPPTVGHDFHRKVNSVSGGNVRVVFHGMGVF
jgi:hypothetical protein